MVPTPFRACSPTKGACDANFFCDSDSMFCAPCATMCDYQPTIQLPVDCRGFCLGITKREEEIPQRQQGARDLIQLPSTASPSMLLALAAVPTSLSPAFHQIAYTKGGLQTEHLASGSQSTSAGMGSLIAVLLLVVAALVVIVIAYMAVTIRRNNQTKPSKTVQAVLQNVEESREPAKSHSTDSNHNSLHINGNDHGANQSLLLNQEHCHVHSCIEHNHHLTGKLENCLESKQQNIVWSLPVETVSDPGLQNKNTDNNCQCGLRGTTIRDNGHSI